MLYRLMLYSLMLYRQMGWIGTVEVKRDTGLEPGETFCLCVSSDSSTVSRFTSTVPIRPV